MSGERLPRSTQRDLKRLEKRLYDVEMRLQALGLRSLDQLDDTQILYHHPTSSPGDGDVVTWDNTISTEFGGAWVAAPSVAGDAATSLAIGEWTDDGTFDEVGAFIFDQSITVNANSYQLVIVTAEAAPSDSALPVDADPVNGVVAAPTPWKLLLTDTTGDPSGLATVGQNSIGGGWSQVAMWVHNDTDDDASHTIRAVAGAVTSAYEFDATVEITIRSVFSLSAV